MAAVRHIFQGLSQIYIFSKAEGTRTVCSTALILWFFLQAERSRSADSSGPNSPCALSLKLAIHAPIVLYKTSCMYGGLTIRPVLQRLWISAVSSVRQVKIYVKGWIVSTSVEKRLTRSASTDRHFNILCTQAADFGAIMLLLCFRTNAVCWFIHKTGRQEWIGLLCLNCHTPISAATELHHPTG